MGKRYCLDCKMELGGHNKPLRCKSCANSGKNNPMYQKNLSIITKEKISNSLKDKPKTREHTEKVRNANKGKIRSMESRIKISLGHTKELTFTGFREKLTRRIKRMREFLKWRSDVFKRDNYHCQNCGERGYLEAHHIIPYSIIIREFKIKDLSDAKRCKILWDIGNGISYCRDCHLRLDKTIGRSLKFQEKVKFREV